MSRLAIVLALFGVAFLAAPAPAAAHHSVTGIFMIDRAQTLEGRLSGVDWVNPHIYFKVDVIDKSGAVTKWRFETLPPGFMRRAGLTKELFADDGGRPVKILFNPPRDPANHTGYALEVIYADGHSYKLGNAPPTPSGGQ